MLAARTWAVDIRQAASRGDDTWDTHRASTACSTSRIWGRSTTLLSAAYSSGFFVGEMPVEAHWTAIYPQIGRFLKLPFPYENCVFLPVAALAVAGRQPPSVRLSPK